MSVRSFSVSRGDPGRTAFYAIVAATTAGTLSGNVLNAPLHTIQTDFLASDSMIVLAVAAFTIAMVVFVPLMGWLCDRFGPIRMVTLGLIVMVVAQLFGAMAPNLETVIVARAIQGMACAAFPPGVQRALVALWPTRSVSSMVAWSSAIGVGQALGPPLGGLITEVVHWRAVFVVQALVCAVITIVIWFTVPEVPGKESPIHGVGMIALMILVGSTAIAITLAGQRVRTMTEVLVVIVAMVALVTYVALAARYPERLVNPKSLWEKRFVRGTANAGMAMFVIGTCLVSVPLILGKMGMSAGPLGLVVFSMALAMVATGPVLNGLTHSLSSRTLLKVGLTLLVVVPFGLGVWTAFATPRLSVQVPVIVVLLLAIGAGIAASQSVAALSISRSPAAQNSMAFGIHNTVRFIGMASGYAWVALILPLDSPLLLYAGPSFVALVALVITVVGGPAQPSNEPVN